MTDLPIACTLNPDERQTRGDELLTGRAQAALERQPIENGLRLVFSGEAALIPRITDTIVAERHCCRFLRFDASFEPDNGPITLTVTGPAGTRDFLETLVNPYKA
jgi:hypothetical protein